MRIDSIELLNYRQYKGNIYIKFYDDKIKNFNVLQGVNGAGKTNLMNAINWCLYGIEEHLEKYSGERQPIMNDAIYNNMEEEDFETVRVKITFIDNDRKNIVFERYQNIIKTKDNYLIDGDERLHAYMQVNNDMVEIEYPNIILNRILPNEIKNFFFFDGERLDEFFTKENTYKIRDAIFDVSQLSILEKSITHLENTIKKIRRKIKDDVNPNIKRLKLKIEQIEKGKESTRKQKEKDEKELKDIRINLEKINLELRESNELLIKQLQKRREELDQSLKQTLVQINTKKDLIVSNLINYGPRILGLDALFKTKIILDDKTEKGEIPSRIKDTFIKELLDNGICICGTDISKENENRIMIENLLNKIVLSEIEDELTDLKYDINNLYDKNSNFNGIQELTRTQLNNLKEKSNDIINELEDISLKLKQFEVIDIAQLEIKRRELKQKEIKLISSIGISENHIKNTQLAIEQYERKLQKELKKDEKNIEIKNKLDLANKTLKLLNKVKNNMIKHIRENVETKTQQYFLELIWKKGVYVDVDIADDYTISVINNEGSQCLGSLSAGERQVLALSFLAALRDVSGFDAPILIDTPLGRISHEPRENIAKLLPVFLDEVQVTMLMTDEEYTESVRNGLRKNVATEYELKFDENNANTTVIPLG